jgi:hypothetical protein
MTETATPKDDPFAGLRAFVARLEAENRGETQERPKLTLIPGGRERDDHAPIASSRNQPRPNANRPRLLRGGWRFL